MTTCPHGTKSADQAIAEAISSPARLSGDQGSVDQRSIPDLIAAKKHLAATEAAANPFRCLRMTRAENGSAVG